MEQQSVGVSGAQPTIFSAPGRVNLIGEHTDYNDGFVMPCAIGLRTHVSVSPRLERKLLIQSEGFPQSFEFDLDELPQHAGHALEGADLFVRSEIPIGAGLSSSAAIEVASALALSSLNGAALPLLDVA